MAAVLEQPTDKDIRGLMQRIQSEYREMPGLRLTLPQAQRLWGLDQPKCEEVLRKLTHSNVLARTSDGAFVLRQGRTAS